MKILKKLLVAALVLGTLTCGVMAADDTAAAETDPKAGKLTVYVVGNSILNHGKAPDIGWNGSWGMAASAQEKDYFHLLQAKAEADGYTGIEWVSNGAANFERSINTREDYGYKAEINNQFAGAKSIKPDVVIFQIGENVGKTTTKAYTNVMVNLDKYFKDINPDVAIIYSQPFWGGNEKVNGVKNAAIETDQTYANLSQYNNSENMAIGLFENSGVASHPGDTGMENIADAFYKQLSVILYKKLVDPEQVEVKLDGSYVHFDVPAQITDGRTMIPVRAVAEAFDAKVDWEGETETVTITKGEDVVIMTLGENFFTKNGEKKELDVPAFETGGRTLVPARAIAEALDCNVSWNEKTWTAIILSPVKEEEAAPEPAAPVKEIVEDPCDDFKNGYYSSTANLSIVEDDDDDHGKVILVEASGAGKAWSYIWSNMTFVPGATYTITADVKPGETDGAGNAITELGIGGCFHHDKADHGVGIKTVYADEWTTISYTYTMPENIEALPGDDAFGIYANPVNDIAATFYVDNISVTYEGGSEPAEKEESEEKPKEEEPKEEEPKKEEADDNADGPAKEIKNDTCESLEKNGYFSLNAKLSVVEDEDKDHGKVIFVEAASAKKEWNYIWANMDFVAGKSYTIKADVKAHGENGAGDPVDKIYIGGCAHYENADHGLGGIEVYVDDGWTEVEYSFTIPETFKAEANTDAFGNSFGVYTNPENDIGCSFYIDNINVVLAD